MKQGAVIMIIDDELQIRRFLRMSLETHGYIVHEAETGEEGMNLTMKFRPDIIILDLGLPDMDGLDFLKKLREFITTPVIILTVKDTDDDKIMLLENGADDYLTKPFSIGELEARIKVALRHSQKVDPVKVLFTSTKIKIDFNKRTVYANEKEIKLTPTEYSFLTLLAKYPGKVVTQNQIMKELWGPNLLDQTHYLRFYALQIRRKIEEDPSNPKILITEPGVGYRLAVD